MKDLKYDINTQDLAFSDGDFELTDNASVQNGFLILVGRGLNSSNPILGINVRQVQGGSELQANYEMNRWKQQVASDGGKASFSTKKDAAGTVSFVWDVSYE